MIGRFPQPVYQAAAFSYYASGLLKALPQSLHGMLSSGIISGGLTAIILNFALPGSPVEYLQEKPADVSMRPEIE